MYTISTMKIKILLIIALLISAGCTPLHITANSLIVADWGQTRDIARNPDFYETNPILGRNPSSGDVDKYFASSILIYNSVYYLAPKKHRAKVSLFVAAFQLNYVLGNYSLGVKMDF